MGTITASLERSLKNCSLNQSTTPSRRPGGGGGGRSTSDSRNDHHPQSNTHSNASSSDDNSAFVQLNSHLSLPYHWEQCLDLKTGEIYYINWSNGMKAKEDPRTGAARNCYCSEEEDESNGYDSEGSSTESSPCSSTSTRESFRSIKKNPVAPGTHELYDDDDDDDDDNGDELSSESILVVAGCKSCLMYYMVPKHVQGCPKCSGQLLHLPANHKPS